MSVMNRAIASAVILALVVGGYSLADDVRELTWDDLVPGGGMVEQPAVAGHDFDEGTLDGDDWDENTFEETFVAPVWPEGVVEELDGIEAKLPGFVVPLELADGGKVKDFLLVPYFGACIHYPPPPPNQIVYVKLDKPVELESAWDPVWAIGELKTEFQHSDLGSAGYTMTADKIEIYEY